MTYMRKIAAILLILFTVLQAKAQLHLGTKAGANMTKIAGESFDKNYKLGYQFGGFIAYDMTSSTAIQVEVLFNQTNTKISNRYTDVLTDAFDRGKKMNYVSVPILLRLNTNGLISIMGGPQFSFLSNGNESLLNNSKKLFKRTDFGLIAGTELNLKPIRVFARYVWGFSDISNIGDKAESRQIQAGIAFRLF